MSNRKKWVVVFTDSWFSENNNDLFTKIENLNSEIILSINSKDNKDFQSFDKNEKFKFNNFNLNKYCIQLIVISIKMDFEESELLIKQLKRINGYFLDFDSLNLLNDIFKTMGNINVEVRYPCEIYENDKK